EDLAARAAGYNMPSAVVDGQEVDAVMSAVGAAVAKARSGGGPTLLEMKTYRFTGHSRGDPAKYRRAGELEQWKARDPLDLYALGLAKSGVGAAEIEAAREGANAMVARAVEAAKAAPMPQPGDMLRHVLADR